MAHRLRMATLDDIFPFACPVAKQPTKMKPAKAQPLSQTDPLHVNSNAQ